MTRNRGGLVGIVAGVCVGCAEGPHSRQNPHTSRPCLGNLGVEKSMKIKSSEDTEYWLHCFKKLEYWAGEPKQNLIARRSFRSKTVSVRNAG